jgi:hypothetical protein
MIILKILTTKDPQGSPRIPKEKLKFLGWSPESPTEVPRSQKKNEADKFSKSRFRRPEGPGKSTKVPPEDPRRSPEMPRGVAGTWQGLAGRRGQQRPPKRNHPRTSGGKRRKWRGQTGESEGNGEDKREGPRGKGEDKGGSPPEDPLRSPEMPRGVAGAWQGLAGRGGQQSPPKRNHPRTSGGKRRKWRGRKGENEGNGEDLRGPPGKRGPFGGRGEDLNEDLPRT